MAEGKKAGLTFKKIRFCLFLRSYGSYRISQSIIKKYKLNKNLKPKELQKKYFKKTAIPEISRLSRVLNLSYKPLWELILLNKTPGLSKKIPDIEKIKAYLSIESELITLSTSKISRSNPFFNPDYEEESAVLSTAIERAAGNKLINIKDDSVFKYQQGILQKLYLRWYYKVAWKYKLPTTRIVPFIIKLIT